jgi:hypothetical protein
LRRGQHKKFPTFIGYWYGDTSIPTTSNGPAL